MSLLIKPPSWGHCTTNLSGTPAAFSSHGTTVTAGANDAMGTAAALITALTHDVEFLVVGFQGFDITNGNGSTLADILIDPAGGSSWSATPLIPTLICGETLSTVVPAMLYYFPLWVPSGASIGCQAQTAHTATNAGLVTIWAYGGNANPGSWWCGQKVTAIGVDTVNSQGTNHTAGNSGAYSSWTDFGSTLPAPCGSLQFAVQGTNTDTTQNAAQYLFEFGVGSQRIGANVHRSTGTGEAGITIMPDIGFCSLPSGAQLQVRAACSGTAEALDVAAYAVH